MINNIQSNYANTVAPFAPVGRAPVSQETTDLKSSTFRPAEQLAESGRALNRRFPDERPNDDVERDRVERGARNNGDDPAAREAAAKNRAEQERQQAERDQIEVLAARDREVRAHEQAHAAVAGQYGSSPTYSFVRGPDGVSYAVGGEVQIDTSPIPGDPEATLRKAQQLRRAANAPAEPSSQDGRVAALAAQMELQARTELAELKSAEAEQRREEIAGSDELRESGQSGQSDSATQQATSREASDAEVRARDEREREKQRIEEEEARLQADQERFETEQRLLDQRQARAEFFNEGARRNIDLNRRLIEIGVLGSDTGIGSFLNKTV
ncbi:putative metalloprotease CJM1_0395 family protein [Cellvibrio sp. pealriver]|uniref:putative metalloprotease CJM1_0395 family protein n=1 Tax=Cellvibrio sp. pealriver TaxID=1622269 RepID=UPI00066FF32C|nr:putative metalloprotease CJM1_0395 family protein [Cellvibrio sp. pealriver]